MDWMVAWVANRQALDFRGGNPRHQWGGGQ